MAAIGSIVSVPRLDHDLDPVVIARQRPGLRAQQRDAARREHARGDPLAPPQRREPVSVDVIVVVIGDAFHRRVQVAVLAERREPRRGPSRRRA